MMAGAGGDAAQSSVEVATQESPSRLGDKFCRELLCQGCKDFGFLVLALVLSSCVALICSVNFRVFNSLSKMTESDMCFMVLKT